MVIGHESSRENFVQYKEGEVDMKRTCTRDVHVMDLLKLYIMDLTKDDF